jgi:dTDP-glucose pyrophosphorylase
VTIVTGHLGEQIEALLGDGRAFGVGLRYAQQPRADGSADAVRRGMEAGATPPLVVTAADMVFGRGDVARFVAEFAATGVAGAIAARREPPPRPGRAPIRIEAGRVTRVIDDDPDNPLSGAPLWGVGEEIAASLGDLPGPPYELATAFQRAIDDGATVAGIEISRTRDLTNPVDLVAENFPYLL